MPDDRRRVPRNPAGWMGRYMFEGQASWGWCRVVDISSLGAGLELHGAVPENCTGCRITVKVESPYELRLVGECRHATREPARRIRVGIEFIPVKVPREEHRLGAASTSAGT